MNLREKGRHRGGAVRGKAGKGKSCNHILIKIINKNGKNNSQEEDWKNSVTEWQNEDADERNTEIQGPCTSWLRSQVWLQQSTLLEGSNNCRLGQLLLAVAFIVQQTDSLVDLIKETVRRWRYINHSYSATSKFLWSKLYLFY